MRGKYIHLIHRKRSPFLSRERLPLSARAARHFPHWGKHMGETCTNMAPYRGSCQRS